MANKKIPRKAYEQALNVATQLVGYAPGEFLADCKKLGLDPMKTSLIDLECVKYGLDSKKATREELTKHSPRMRSVYQKVDELAKQVTIEARRLEVEDAMYI